MHREGWINYWLLIPHTISCNMNSKVEGKVNGLLFFFRILGTWPALPSSIHGIPTPAFFGAKRNICKRKSEVFLHFIVFKLTRGKKNMILKRWGRKWAWELSSTSNMQMSTPQSCSLTVFALGAAGVHEAAAAVAIFVQNLSWIGVWDWHPTQSTISYAFATPSLEKWETLRQVEHPVPLSEEHKQNPMVIKLPLLSPKIRKQAFPPLSEVSQFHSW